MNINHKFELADGYAYVINLENGSAYIDFINSNGDKIGEVYVDDYDNAKGNRFKEIANALMESEANGETIEETIGDWENGHGDYLNAMDSSSECWSEKLEYYN